MRNEVRWMPIRVAQRPTDFRTNLKPTAPPKKLFPRGLPELVLIQQVRNPDPEGQQRVSPSS